MLWRQSSFLVFVVTIAGCGSDATAPTLPSRPMASVALTAGARFTCALTTDAKPFCWGEALAGQLGDSSFNLKLVPTATAGGHSFVAIAAGNQTACALERTGVAWCWGDDPMQPGVPVSYRNVPVAVAVPRPLVAITVGQKFACGLDTEGSAYCWGKNDRGQLGVGDTLSHSSPTRVLGSLRFTSITAGFWHTCGLASTGLVSCWGDNTYGELGSGDTLSVSAPRQVSGTTTFRSVSAGSIHQCAIATTGGTFCWGANFSGQLGDGTGVRRLVPTPSAAGLTFTSLRAGRANSIFATTCGITAAGDVYCWGYNSKGQLGNPSSRDACTVPSAGGGTITLVCSHTPVKANGISNAVAMDVGQEHTCVLTSSSQLLCWGENVNGQLGDGSGVAQPSPVTVKGGLIFP